MNNDFYGTVEFSIYKGLLGEVNPSLRAVSFDWNESQRKILIIFYHDGDVTSSIVDHYSLITSESNSADFGMDIQLDYKIVRCDSPKELPEDKNLIYKRKETPIQGFLR